MNFDRIASELLRAIRGKRSQLAFSRRLGYRSNIAARWEAGRCWPTAAGTLSALQRTGLDVRACLRAFFRIDRPWLTDLDPCTREGVAALLGDLRGNVSIVEVAHTAGFSRFSVARWLHGDAQPKLPEFLQLIEALSLRLLDFVGVFTDPSKLPSLNEAWARHNAARDAAFERPWSHAVLRALELEDYRQRSQHQSSYLAQRLGIPAREVDRCLAVLDRAGQIARRGALWSPTDEGAIDLRSDTERLRNLKAFWLDVARQRLQDGVDGVFGFNVFACSQADLVALRELYLAYFHQMRSRIGQSTPSECVALFSTQLVQLDRPR